MRHLVRASLVGAILFVLVGMVVRALEFGGFARVLTSVAVVVAAGLLAPSLFYGPSDEAG